MASSTLSKLSGFTSIEFSILQSRERLLGLAAEVSKYTHYKGDLLDFNSVPYFHVVGNMNASALTFCQLLMYAFLAIWKFSLRRIECPSTR